MSWESVTAIATAFTGCVIAITAIVGVYQLRQFREQRRDAAAIEIMRSLQDVTFARAFHIVFTLPEGSSPADFRDAGTEAEEAAQIVGFRFETIGLLVYRRTLSFELVEELIGAAVLLMWRRLRGFITQTRKQKNYPMFCEWFQWLAEQLEKRGRLTQPPAYVRWRDWTPM